MSKRINIRFAFALILMVIYNFFFWKEKLGLNLLVFSFLFAAAIIISNSGCLKNKKVMLVFTAVIYSGIMVVVNNSFYSKFSVFTSLMLLAGYAHQPRVKALFSSYAVCLADYLLLPASFINAIIRSKEKSRVFRIIFTSIKLIIIPFIVVFIFYLIYAVSNQKFDFYSGIVIKDISDFLYDILKDYTFVRFMFIFMGLILIAGVLHSRRFDFIAKIDNSFTDKLSRNKTLKLIWLNNGKRYVSVFRAFRFTGIKFYSMLTEYRMGVILLVLVNLLILGFNIVDIKFLWLSFDPAEIPVLSDFVYTGTYLLIFSISLSMLILLYYYRGNINFYKKNRFLTYLAYIWIGQNAFMASSVFLRNYYYIIYTHTISYKKIGVIIFLALTIAGLVTMVLKVSQKRTSYNIFKTNAWIVFAMLMIMCSFNWDKEIAEYNLANPNTVAIDIAYLLELSDDVLPYLNEKSELMKRDFFIPRNNLRRMIFAQDYYYGRVDKFKREQEGYSRLSWNYSDYVVNEYFKTHDVKEIEKINN